MSRALPVHVQAFAEPAEREDPRNALVRAFEAQLQAMIDNDLEGPVRAIVARVLPAPEPVKDLFEAKSCIAPSDTASRSRPEGAENSSDALTASIFADAGELHLSALISELARVEKLKLNGLAHAAVASIKTQAAAALAMIVAERTGPKTEASQE